MFCDIIIFIIFFPWILQGYTQIYLFNYGFQIGTYISNYLNNSTFC